MSPADFEPTRITELPEKRVAGLIIDDGEHFNLRTEQGRRALFERTDPYVARPCTVPGVAACERKP